MGKKKKKDRQAFDLENLGKLMSLMTNVQVKQIDEFNEEGMAIFGSNINLKRHINDIRDDLKPVQRRIMMTMYLKKMLPSRPYTICARIVGDCIGQYHPHGDIALYSALIKLSQEWGNIMPLIDPFGSVGSAYDPKGYAAMRYPSARMSEFAWDCFFKDWDPGSSFDGDITVDYVMNYDDTELEATYLPAKYPLFLINWHTAMGLGKYTCTPGFDIETAFNAVLSLIKNPDDQFEMYPEDPQGCSIVNKKDLKGFLDKKSVNIRVRSNYNIQEINGKTYIIITSVPFEVSPAKISENITELYKNGIFPEINNIGFESTDLGKSFELQIEIKKGYDPHAVMTKLYKRTQLQKTFATRYSFVNDLEPVEYVPRIAILEWIRYRRNAVRRMKKIKLIEITKRVHVLKAIIGMIERNEIDGVIDVVRHNKRDKGLEKLITKFNLTDYQAEKIIGMRIEQLSEDNYDDYCKELKKLKKDAEEIRRDIETKENIDEIIINELKEGIKKYAKPRRTELIQLIDSVKIENTDHFLIFTNKYIKKIPFNPAGYKIGKIDSGEKVIKIMTVNNRDKIALFDKAGKIHIMGVHEIGNTNHQSVGISLQQLGLSHDFVASIILDQDFKGMISTVTKNGMISNTSYEEILGLSNKKYGLMNVDKNDELAGVTVCDIDDKLMVYTTNGKCVVFPSSDVGITGRNTKGVQAIKLNDEDAVSGVINVRKNDTFIVTCTDRGYMKRFKIKGMPKTKRNDEGIEINSGNGKLVSAIPFNDLTEVLYGYTTVVAFEFDPLKITATNRIGQNDRVIELSQGEYLFDVIGRV